jgi:hypothetical protein
MGQHLAGVHDEMAQQVEFLRGQLYLLAAAQDVAADQIDRQVARNKNRQFPLRLEGATQCRAHSRHQLRHAEGLADVIVGAEVERLDHRPLVMARRQHDDWHRRCLADLADKFEAALVRKTEVEDHQIRLLGCQQARGSRGVFGFDDAIVGCAEAGAQKAPYRRLVVDDQDSAGNSHAPIPAPACCAGRLNGIL